MTSLHFAHPENPAEEFLLGQLAYAQAQIERLTRHLSSMRQNLIAAGQTELAADALLAESSKPWRQFRKDYAFFHGLYLRLQRMLRPFTQQASPHTAPAQAVVSTKIGRNQPCPCASGRKYKFCCLNKTKSESPVPQEASHPPA